MRRGHWRPAVCRQAHSKARQAAREMTDAFPGCPLAFFLPGSMFALLGLQVRPLSALTISIASVGGRGEAPCRGHGLSSSGSSAAPGMHSGRWAGREPVNSEAEAISSRSGI